MNEKFKLEGLLKLKKFNEQREKIKMGKILKKMGEQEIEISNLNESLKEMYTHQFKQLKEGVAGKDLRTYPIMIQSVRDKIENYKEGLIQLKQDYENSRRNLNTVLGEVEVLQKLEDEHKNKYHKYRNGKREREIEDIVNMRRGND